MRKPNELELAYFAGYFDGEGCIHISKNGARIVAIKSCYPKVVKSFHKFYGGTFTNFKKDKKNHYCRGWFYFRIFGDNAVNVIKNLYPFLREKKEQARLFLKHASSKDGHTKAQYAVQIKSLKKIIY